MNTVLQILLSVWCLVGVLFFTIGLGRIKRPWRAALYYLLCGPVAWLMLLVGFVMFRAVGPVLDWFFAE